MTANALIDLIESQGLLDPEVIAEIRRNVAQSKARITVEALAKLLVENGQLTRFQATRLIGQLQEASGKESLEPRPFSKPLAPPAKTATSSSDELELLPDGEESPANKPDPDKPLEAKILSDDEIVEAVEVIEAPEDSVPPPARPKRKSKQRSPHSPEIAGSPSVAGELASTYVKPVKIASTKSDSWDAFRIWGVGFILTVLLALLSWLVYWVMSGNSAAFYAQAQEAYESRDYEVAIERFGTYAKKFPKEDRASAARSFAAIATIRQLSDQLGDPAKAIDAAESVLPTIVNETAMGDTGIRADLASALVSVAEKMLQRADAAKTTADRKGLIEKLDKHLGLMKNPQYIPNANRITNESRIKSIEEERERILRDVMRAEDLVIAMEKMKEAIAKEDVQGAYTARRTVVRKYPQLALDSDLLSLLRQATAIQQKIVKTTTFVPKAIDPSATASVGRSVFLFKQSGSTANVDADTILCVKAKGSIYGLRGSDGQVLWRRYVGSERFSEPLRLSTEPASDCVIVLPNSRRLARIAARDGSTVWEVELAETILQPSVEGNTLFAATKDGNAYALDLETGQAKWSKQIPQSLHVGMGGGSSKSARYLVGDHSNLYVLARSDGACTSVYYLGHEPGTIAIPPVYALGHVILFQNVAAGVCEIKLLKAGDDPNTPLEIAQASIPPLKGHVLVPPSLDGRRLVVMTDLGEIVAYDVEPASSGDKLNRIATIVGNETKPRLAWPLVAGNELWIASNRFSRFQIQVSKQKLVSDWILEDEDQFTSRPIKVDDYVVHTRVVRGTQGVRVTAAKGDTGQSVWEVDLGVPVAALQGLSSGGLAAINSQAAYYPIDAATLGAGKPISAKENPGRNQRGMLFTDPVTLANGRLVMLNVQQGNHALVFDPSSSSGTYLGLNRLQLGTGIPSAEPLAVGPGLLVPLNNAQLAYVDPSSGKALSAPFQPTLTVGVDMRWLPAALLSDQQTIVAATNQKTLHRLSSGKQIQELSQTDTASPWVQRLAVIGDQLCGVARGDAQDALQFYNGIDLSRIGEAEIDGRVTWGPYSVGERFLIHSETSGLAAFDKAGKQLWQTPLPGVALIGPPVLQDEDILISSPSGSMFRFSPENGKLRAAVKIGEPLAGPPFAMGNILLFPGSEGVLIAVPLQSTMTSTAEVDAL